MKVRSIIVAAILIIGVTACEKNEPSVTPSNLNQEFKVSPVILDIDAILHQSAFKSTDVYAWATAINEALLEHGLQLEKMETYGAEEQGIYVYFKETGNKQLYSDYVPNDPRNYGGILVPYIIDNNEMTTSSGLDASQTIPAIISAMTTWDEVKCSQGLVIPNWGELGDIGLVQYLLGYGGNPWEFPGMIVHGGILPIGFFDEFSDGNGANILGVTFTFIWGSNEGGTFIPSDIDNNGKTDVALKEIYFNDKFSWQVDGNHYDFETVVLHEVGHGLSQAHFGKAFVGKNGKLHFAPRALMNNAYSGVQREITKTDIAGHCSNWAEWPNN